MARRSNRAQPEENRVHSAGRATARESPFQAIIVGLALPGLPDALVEQLGVGGRLVVALGSPNAELITRVRRGATSVTTGQRAQTSR